MRTFIAQAAHQRIDTLRRNAIALSMVESAWRGIWGVGLLTLGLLAAVACADRGRGTDRSAGRTKITELNVNADDKNSGASSIDSGVSSTDDPPIEVMEGEDVGYEAYRRWLATEQGLIGPVCDCAVSFGAYGSVGECQSAVTGSSSEDTCIADFTRTYPEGSAIFFDCLSGASMNFERCLRSRSCLDQSDYEACAEAYNAEFEGCGASLNDAEVNALNGCAKS